MIRLNKMTDYAVVVMTQLGRDSGTTRTAAQVSGATMVPLPTVSKLLKALVHDGLLTSHRGAAGGYALDRALEDISIAEVIQAIEGPVALTACVDGADDNCEVERLCPMRGNWNKVNQVVRRALEDVSLADMAVPSMLFPVTRGAGDELGSGV